MKKKILFLKTPVSIIAFVASFEVILLSNLMLLTQFKNLPPLIPLWYAKILPIEKLATPKTLIILPALSILVLLVNFLLIEALFRKRERLLPITISIFTLIITILLNSALIRIILISVPTRVYIPNHLLKPLSAFLVALVIAYLLTPLTIKLANKFSIVDDPETHIHPAILHNFPIPRSGAAPVFLAILISGLVFLPLEKKFIGIYLGALASTITGVLDDKYNLNPYLRLLVLMPISVVFVVVAGIGITFFTNPFGDYIPLDSINIRMNLWGEHHILLLADLFAFFWILWVMNMISWSNGVDGQFPGIVAIAAIVVGILSLRFISYDPSQLKLAILSFITAGAVLGTLPYVWHPARIFYGFGATMLGLILATLAILSGTKVATALLVLMVPVLDALYAIIRRILNRRSPVWADKKHLHHQLLELGWTHQKVAIFYWILTAFFGLLALYSSGKTKLLSIIVGIGIGAFILIFINWQKSRSWQLKSGSEIPE